MRFASDEAGGRNEADDESYMRYGRQWFMVDPWAGSGNVCFHLRSSLQSRSTTVQSTIVMSLLCFALLYSILFRA